VTEQPTRAEYPNEGYDDFVDAAREGEAYYLRCPNGHGSLPPRRVCPDCGETDLAETPLPDAGEIETFTVTHVASPNFSEDTPYATAVADFGPVKLTAQVRDVDPDDVAVGAVVDLDVEETATTGDPVLVFRPR